MNRIFAALMLTLLLVGVAGAAPTPSVTPMPTQTGTPTQTATPTATPSPTVPPPTPIYDLSTVFGSPVPTPAPTSTPIAAGCHFEIYHNPILSDGTDPVQVSLRDGKGALITAPQTVQVTLPTGQKDYPNAVYPASIKATSPGSWTANIITPGYSCTGITIVACPTIVSGACQ